MDEIQAAYALADIDSAFGRRVRPRLGDLLQGGAAAAQVVQNLIGRFAAAGGDSDEAGMIAAGGTDVTQRTVHKRTLKRRRLGKKLEKEAKRYTFRWQRMYNYGLNTNAYPQDRAQSEVATLGGRLQLNHVATVSSTGAITQADGQLFPYYMCDMTCWRTASSYGNPMKRFQFDGAGWPSWVTQLGQKNIGNDLSVDGGWQIEKTPLAKANPYPSNLHQQSVLNWFDARMMFYGARKHQTTFHIELVQFKDPDVLAGFHSTDTPYQNQPGDIQEKILDFWTAEMKRLIYNPIDVQQDKRSDVVKVLYHESFVIAPDNTTNLDVAPPCAERRLKEVINRLCKWDWLPGPVTLLDTDIERAEWQVEEGAGLEPVCDPKARVFLLIRCEDYEPVAPTAKLSTTATNPYQKYDGTSTALPAQPPNTVVVGYDCCVQTLDNNKTIFYAPRLEGQSSTWSIEDSPSFDIIVRTSWLVQD